LDEQTAIVTVGPAIQRSVAPVFLRSRRTISALFVCLVVGPPAKLRIGGAP